MTMVLNEIVIQNSIQYHIDMKNLRTILTSVLFVATVLGVASPVMAQPRKDTPSYYLLGGNDKQASWMSTAIETNNGISSAWVLVYMFKPETVKAVEFQSLWFLVEANCSTGMNRIVQIDINAPDGHIIGSDSNNEPFSVPTPTSPSGAALMQICHPESSPAILMTQEQITELLGKLMSENKVVPPTA